MDQILKVDNLTFSYRKNCGLLEDVSFDVSKGDVLSVIGPNGAGKTTLFKCILGQLRPSSGSIMLDGAPVLDYSARERARKIAYIPQIMTSAFDYTVLDTVLLGTANSLGVLSVPGKSQQEAALSALSMVGMGDFTSRRMSELDFGSRRMSELDFGSRRMSELDFINRKMSELSGGERQLVYIARALAQKADILVMDEPTSSLDYGNQIKIMNVITSLGAAGHTILISMHNPKAARKYSTKTLALMDGHVRAFGDSSAVITEEFINELYEIH